ncbi:MAG TPA: type III pantothenate kinase [Planctomycetota bacterium]|nr:type III pantothenate kinase [Planctomycetota bacterium]
MDLVADVGNTRCHLAAFEMGAIVHRFAARGDLGERELVAEWDRFLAAAGRPGRAAIASVNPPVEEKLARWMRGRGLEPLVLGKTLPARIELAVREPGKVGADRIAQALWAARKRPGRAVLVASFGTALCYSLVSSRGVFEGGAIAPGLALQAGALARGTALLPEVGLDEAPRAIGRDTRSSIEAGIYFGACALTDRLAIEMERATGEKLHVVATGGDAAVVARGSTSIAEVVPDVTLEGVAIALSELVESAPQ